MMDFFDGFLNPKSHNSTEEHPKVQILQTCRCNEWIEGISFHLSETVNTNRSIFFRGGSQSKSSRIISLFPLFTGILGGGIPSHRFEMI